MAENSGIEWTDHTFNPWMGCQKVSPACKNCYAERDFDLRYKKVKWGPTGTRVKTAPANWKKPLKWNREAWQNGVRPRVFCASLADVFEDWQGPIRDHNGMELSVCHACGEYCYFSHECKHRDNPMSERVPRMAVMDDLRRDLFKLIDATPNIDWLLLTKRPENIRRMWSAGTRINDYCPKCESREGVHGGCDCGWLKAGGRPRRHNVWLGTSVENQEYADKRVPDLLDCRDLSPVLFLSCEPLVGPVDLDRIQCSDDPANTFSCLNEEGQDGPHIDWVITGGESGPGARPQHPDWFHSLRDQCVAAGVPFHFKQWGEWIPMDVYDPFEHGYDSDKYEHRFLYLDGTDHPDSSKSDLPISTFRVGVKATGRILDGRTWDGLPEVAKC